jgi:hypothetical protein
MSQHKPSGRDREREVERYRGRDKDKEIGHAPSSIIVLLRPSTVDTYPHHIELSPLLSLLFLIQRLIFSGNILRDT